MNALAGFVRGVDALNEWTGRAAAWLALGCVLTCFTVVLLRYAFGIGFPWMQELYVWLHAAVFMAGAGYTMLHRGHVNVDVFYGRMDGRRRAWVDIAGTLLFLQGLALIARRALYLAGRGPAVPDADADPSAAPELPTAAAEGAGTR